MPLAVKHTLQTVIADDPSFDVSSSEWNADHSMTGVLPIVNGGTNTTTGISAEAQAALDLKAPLASPAFTGTPTGITKTHVGLGNVDNTSDAAKPISTATQTALDLKAPLFNPVFTGTPSAPNPAAAENSVQIATTKFVKDQSIYTPSGSIAATSIAGAIAELDAEKAPLAHTHAQGDVTNLTSDLALKAPIASPTFTGTVTLAADPGSALQAATKQYVDGRAPAQATAAQYLNNTAGLMLTTDKVWAAAASIGATTGASLTPDFATGFDFWWTLNSAAGSLLTPTNIKAGQKGTIYVIQDGSGSRLITTWGTAFKFPGGTKPTLSTAANAVDAIYYSVYDSTRIYCSFLAGFA